MFENLSKRLSKIVENINIRGFLTKDNIKDTLNEVRIALLEADVSLPVIYSFISDVKEKAFGHIIRKGLTPSQEFINIVFDSLMKIMGSKNLSLNLSAPSPIVFLIVGFQGAGKTTTCAKLAKYLQIKERKRVLLCSVDIYRPSGIKQLEILANTASVDFFQVEDPAKKVLDIASDALLEARLGVYDVLLVDTVGCLSKDHQLISEIVDLSSLLNPTEILFIVDAMLGQESVNISNFFSLRLSLSGVILTKVDGDSRGGAAFSVYYTIKKPIKFVGTGEKVDDLDLFHADRIVNRILGMGDIVSLIEDIKNKVKNVTMRNSFEKLNTGDIFDLSDFLNYLKQMRNIGGINRIVDRLPIMNNSFSETIKSKIDDNALVTMEVIINSMTMEERKYPDIIRASRKKRIAFGSGVLIQDVNILLNRFKEVQFIMKKIQKNGLSQVLHNLQKKLFSNFFVK